jgi:hypothetical protein
MVWRGAGRGASLPHPKIIPRERFIIRMCLLAFPGISYRDIADRLNRRYRHYNGGCRTPYGVYWHIKYRVRLIAG